MTLNELRPGERFMLCRTRRIYTSTGRRVGGKGQRIVVVGSNGHERDYNHQCAVKRVVRL